jgi:NAD(P)-dependent dehydrogenase (short-subunit alcohol dehydrogenase family)
VDTEFNWRLDDEIGVRQQGLAPGQFMKERAASVPLGRLAEPADIARVVVFLASPGGSYVTGQAVTVDGGFLMR